MYGLSARGFDPETTSDVGTEWGPQIWLCVYVCISVVSGTVASKKRERRAFGSKTLYEPNRTGRFSTVFLN